MKNKSLMTTVAALGVALASVSLAAAVEKKLAVAASDVTFAQNAALGGMTEVALGQVAAQNGASAEVKEFGQMMVTDHSQAGENLKGIARAQHIPLPEKLDAEHQELVDKMAKLEGAEFDRAYVSGMVQDHEKVLKEFESEAGQSEDTKLKSFAAETSVVIQKHLDKIKMINAAMK